MSGRGWALPAGVWLAAGVSMFAAGVAWAGPGSRDDAPSSPAEVIEEVRARNPGLKGLQAGVDAAGHTAPQASSFPDPTLTVGLSNYPFSTGQTPMSGVQFDLKQRLPWFRKLNALEAAARQDQRIQAALRVEKTNTLVARAWSLLWELTYLHEQRRLALEIGATLDDLVEVARAAYAVGKGRQQDLIKPVVQHQRIDEMVVGIDRQAGILLSELNRLRDREPDAVVIPPAMPKDGDSPPVLKISTLLDYARRHNPMVDLRENAIGKQQEMLTAAREDYVPDFTVGLQYRARWIDSARDPVGGADFFGVTISVGLPVYAATKQSERVEEMKSRLKRAELFLDDTANEVADGIERTALAVERDREQAAIYVEKIIPDTEKALDSSLLDYQQGRIEFLSVLDNLMSLFRARVEHARRVTRIEASLAELEHWLGGPLNEAMITTPSGDAGR